MIFASYQNHLTTSFINTDKKKVKRTIQSIAAQPDDTKNNHQTLTGRELEVLRLLAEGHTSAEIKDKLFISYNTAENHRRNILTKLEARNAAHAIAIALRNGMIR